MTIGSFTALVLTCTFLLPGFIIKSIIDAFTPQVNTSAIKYFFSCLFYSIINLSIWGWLYSLILGKIQPAPWWILLVVILTMTIVSSLLIAMVIATVKQKRILNLITSKLNISKMDPIPSAWDYVFSRSEGSWVVVSLEDGRTVYGKYSSNSFSSSDAQERDLYLEAIYDTDDNNNWIEIPNNKGVLIAGNNIRTIEFFKDVFCQ